MAQHSALRHADARSSAPAPRARVAHAHQRCGPERHPSDQRARPEHTLQPTSQHVRTQHSPGHSSG
eukprot:5535444-Prymnesium_polylepis.2